MNRRWVFAALILLTTAAAAAYRLPKLGLRPMHVDEAVHAEKFNILWSQGRYRYNPREYHGPTLYYFTFPSVWIGRVKDFVSSSEATYRIVPALFGVALIPLLLLVGNGIGRGAVACAAVLTTVSHAMVFYSRYYIQEMLLVFFTFALIGCAWRYVQTKRVGWAVMAGMSLGFMQATKETCMIALGAMVVALAAPVWMSGRPSGIRAYLKKPAVIYGLIAAVVVSVASMSTFATNPVGPLDSIRAYATYLGRAGGGGLHDHPWHYYLSTLLWTRYAPHAPWSEGLIVGLCALGLIAVLTRKGVESAHLPLARFLAVYTILMTIIYSAIPYKSPWSMLSFLHGMILLGGVGVVALLRWLRVVPLQAVAGVALAAATVQLAQQATRGNFTPYAYRRNPYVYSQTVPNLIDLAQRVKELAAIHPDGDDMVVKLVVPNHDYWPLPWYLRSLNNVGCWDAPPDDCDAPVIVTSPDAQPQLDANTQQTYQINDYGLRYQVHLLLYVEQSLWDQFIETRAACAKPG